MATSQPSPSHRWIPGLTLLLLLVSTPIAYFGLSGSNTPAASNQPVDGATPESAEAFVATFPEAQAPMGPHREQFHSSCTLCHSTRLVFTQPKLTEKQWGAVVHKMVAVYAAPITPEQEKDIVAYLAATWAP